MCPNIFIAGLLGALALFPAPVRAQTVFDFDVVVDEPQEGVVWALGQSYKASFTGSGTTFFPRLGREAQEHEPVGFSLASVHLAGDPLAFELDVAPVLTPDKGAVVFDRGSLRESYRLERDSIEQLFTLDAFPGAGDLELSVDVTSQHARSASADRLELRGAHATVRYSRAIAVDATGARTPLATEWIDAGIRIRVTAASLAGATYPLVIDPVIDSFTLAQGTPQDSAPDMALNMSSYLYLVVWERFSTVDDRDVLARWVTRDFLPLGGPPISIDITTQSWTSPRVASNRSAGNFLITAAVGPFSNQSVYTRLLTTLSTTPGPAQFVSAGRNPDVGGDMLDEPGTPYLVVFSNGPNIQGRFVNTAGTVLSSGGFNSEPPPGQTQVGATVSKSAGSNPADRRWTVVYQRNTPSGGDTYALQYRPSSSFALFPTPVAATAASEINPSVTTLLEGSGEPRYVVCQEFFVGNLTEVKLTLMQGATVLDSHTLQQLDGSPAGATRFNADVASDGENVVVAYQEEFSELRISSFRIENGSLVLVEGRAEVQSNFGLEGLPSVLAARDGGGSHGRFPIVWNGFGNGDIIGAAYDVPAPNDTCADARPIGLGVHRGTLVGATLDVQPGCGFPNGAPTDIWYRFTSSVTGTVTISTCGTADMFGIVGGASTILSIYDDSTCTADPASERCSDTSAPVFCDIHGDDSILEFDAVAGNEYLLRVGTKFLPMQEDILLTLTATVADPGVTFCTCTHDDACDNTSSTTGCSNSTGTGAILVASGSRSITAGNLTLQAQGMPGGAMGILFAGNNPNSLPFFDGRRCSAGPFFRFPIRTATASGSAMEPGPGVPSIAERVSASVGVTSRFQWWYRDSSGPCATGANYSSGFAVTWAL